MANQVNPHAQDVYWKLANCNYGYQFVDRRHYNRTASGTESSSVERRVLPQLASYANIDQPNDFAPYIFDATRNRVVPNPEKMGLLCVRHVIPLKVAVGAIKYVIYTPDELVKCPDPLRPDNTNPIATRPCISTTVLFNHEKHQANQIERSGLFKDTLWRDMINPDQWLGANIYTDNNAGHTGVFPRHYPAGVGPPGSILRATGSPAAATTIINFARLGTGMPPIGGINEVTPEGPRNQRRRRDGTPVPAGISANVAAAASDTRVPYQSPFPHTTGPLLIGVDPNVQARMRYKQCVYAFHCRGDKPTDDVVRADLGADFLASQHKMRGGTAHVTCDLFPHQVQGRVVASLYSNPADEVLDGINDDNGAYAIVYEYFRRRHIPRTGPHYLPFDAPPMVRQKVKFLKNQGFDFLKHVCYVYHYHNNGQIFESGLHMHIYIFMWWNVDIPKVTCDEFHKVILLGRRKIGGRLVTRAVPIVFLRVILNYGGDQTATVLAITGDDLARRYRVFTSNVLDDGHNDYVHDAIKANGRELVQYLTSAGDRPVGWYLCNMDDPSWAVRQRGTDHAMWNIQNDVLNRFAGGGLVPCPSFMPYIANPRRRQARRWFRGFIEALEQQGTGQMQTVEIDQVVNNLNPDAGHN